MKLALLPTILVVITHITPLQAATEIVTTSIESGSGFGKVKAEVTYDEGLLPQETGLNLIVFNPGANVAPENMRVFSTTAARSGFMVVMLKNAWNLAILPNSQRNSFRMVDLIRSNDEIFAGIPSGLREKLSSAKILVTGHSMGAAVLSKANTKDQGQIDGFVFLGASKLLSEKTIFESETFFMFGSLDGLVKREVVENLAEVLDSSIVVLDEVNHFCIIDDASVGDPIFRRFDNPTEKSVADCNDTLVRSILLDTITWNAN